MNEPAVSIEFRLEKFPVSEGTDIYRWSNRPLGGTAFIDGRIAPGGWGGITTALSDEQGNHQVGRAGAELDDNDGLIRTLLHGQTTRFFENREASCKIHSPAGRIAGTARSLFRGRMTGDIQLGQRHTANGRQRTARIEMTDALAPFLDQMIPRQVFTAQDFPDIDARLIDTPIPLVGGEHNDGGSVDPSGAITEKGMVPAIFVGMRRTVNDDPTSGVPAFLAPPVLSGSVVGAAGTTPYTYVVTAHSAVGETIGSNQVTVLGPASLSGSNYVALTWPAIAGATGYTVYGRLNPTPVRRLAILPAGTTSYNDTGVATEQPGGPPSTNTAQIPASDGSFFWDFYVVALGVVEIMAVYGSDVAPGTSPRRINLNATAGVDILVPGLPGWPHAQPYVTLPSGLRVTGFYARGPRSYHAQQGILTFAVQTCGYEDVGDGSGDSIQEAFPLFQHFLNQFVFGNYTGGNWLPLQTYESDAAIPFLWTSKFADAQDLTRGWLETDEGYRAGIYLRDRITVREFIRLYNDTFGSFTATNHHGQLYPVLIDETAEPTAGRVYREHIEIKRMGDPQIDRSQIEPLVRFQYDWDPDGQRYRSEIERVTDDVAIEAQKGEQPRDVGIRESAFTRDFATARDARGRRHRRLKYARRLHTVVTNYHGLQDEPGDQILLQHSDMIGGGAAFRPHIVVSKSIDPNVDEVTLTCLDVTDLLAVTMEFLQDETTMTGNLGDETSSQPPPVGAFELT